MLRLQEGMQLSKDAKSELSLYMLKSHIVVCLETTIECPYCKEKYQNYSVSIAHGSEALGRVFKTPHWVSQRKGWQRRESRREGWSKVQPISSGNKRESEDLQERQAGLRRWARRNGALIGVIQFANKASLQSWNRKLQPVYEVGPIKVRTPNELPSELRRKDLLLCSCQEEARLRDRLWSKWESVHLQRRVFLSLLCEYLWANTKRTL